MIKQKKFYITTAIHYSSGLPHIGHVYENVLTDIIARYKRLINYDVYFLTGLDEHGQKIFEKAQENNKTPEEWTDYIATKFLDLWKTLDISNDNFIRTTDKYHVKAVQEAFTELYKKKYITLGQWETLYCVGCEESYTESEAIKKDDGLYCRVGHKLTTKKEPSYFLLISQFQDWIKRYLEINPDFLIPSYRNKELINSFLKEKLLDLSVSRYTTTWGIEILEDKKHTIYVWLDALLNYVTALGYKQKNDDNFKKYWEDKECEIVHVVGKDIARFHAIYWPIILKCLELRLPTHILSHGWIMAEDGRKMSKSFNNVIDPVELIKEFDTDIIRYYFAKEFSIESDNNFSKEILVNIYNSDLANIYGNLVSRFFGICKTNNIRILKYNKETLLNETNDVILTINEVCKKLEKLINNFHINEVLKEILKIGQATNKYIEDTKPWELRKNNKIQEINEICYYIANSIRVICILLEPVLIKGINKIIQNFNFNKNILEYNSISNFSLLNNFIVNENSEIIYKRKII